MTRCRREISKDIYDRAVENRGFIISQDAKNVFTVSELIGYGVYGDQVFEEDGKFYVGYMLGSSCD